MSLHETEISHVTVQKIHQWDFHILWVFDQELCYEVFGQDAGAAEELLIKCVVNGRHIGQRLLLVVTQERRRAAQAMKRGKEVNSEVEGNISWVTDYLVAATMFS